MPDDAWGSTTTAAFMKEIDALRAENQRLERDLEMMYEHDRDHSAEIGRLKAELEKRTNLWPR